MNTTTETPAQFRARLEHEHQDDLALRGFLLLLSILIVVIARHMFVTKRNDNPRNWN